MPLELHDTLSREVLPVLPMDGQELRYYCCGPTVYGPAHIGNFRSFILQDIFRRALETSGVKTKHVRNLTDVDDKTIRQSQEEGVSLSSFTERWTQRFHQDSQALNMLAPHEELSAVVHIPEQIALIEMLLEKKHAYQAPDGSVYYDVRSFPAYGKLSRLAEREITTDQVERENSDEYERESAADFALWKARCSEDGENFWQSPWGEGRPGWHTECCAMSMKYLGESFDVHSGGVDLVFPHHENEIAQSEVVTGKPFARHWFHIAHLMVDGKKMSKSLGNLYTLQDIEDQKFSAQELRYVLLSGSYRQPLNFTFNSLKAARRALAKLAEFATKIDFEPSGAGALETNFGPFQPVQDALLKDLATPEALGRLFKLVHDLSGSVGQAGFEPEKMRKGFQAVCDSFGIRIFAAKQLEQVAPAAVRELAEKRWEAKRAKDWALADQLRAEILSEGWEVKDSKDGYKLNKAVLPAKV